MLTIVLWVKMLNNGIRADLTEQMRFEPKFEGSKGMNHVNIRSSSGEGSASPREHAYLASSRTSKGASMCRIEQESNWR